MKTRLLLVASAVLLGGAYVAAQVESPAEEEASRSAEEVSASTSAAKPDGDLEGGSFENSSSTSTFDPSGARPAGEEDIGLPDRERMENRRRERGAVEDDAGTDAETDSGSNSGSDSDADAVRDSGAPGTDTDSQTRPQRP